MLHAYLCACVHVITLPNLPSKAPTPPLSGMAEGPTVEGIIIAHIHNNPSSSTAASYALRDKTCTISLQTHNGRGACIATIIITLSRPLHGQHASRHGIAIWSSNCGWHDNHLQLKTTMLKTFMGTHNHYYHV